MLKLLLKTIYKYLKEKMNIMSKQMENIKQDSSKTPRGKT